LGGDLPDALAVLSRQDLAEAACLAQRSPRQRDGIGAPFAPINTFSNQGPFDLLHKAIL
jgi:hypothetical protein